MPQHALQVTTYDTAEEAARGLARDISGYVREQTVPALLLLSGGSALSVVERLSVWDDMKGLTIVALDERFDPTNRESNLAHIAGTTWFSRATANGASAIDTGTLPVDTSETLAERFSQALAAWRMAHPTGIIVGLFGMGDDGHTAGIFPLPEDERTFTERFQGERAVVAYRAPDTVKNPFRITVTLSYIRSFARGFAYLCGENKRKKLDQLRRNEPLPLSVFPAGILKELPMVSIATDITF